MARWNFSWVSKVTRQRLTTGRPLWLAASIMLTGAAVAEQPPAKAQWLTLLPAAVKPLAMGSLNGIPLLSDRDAARRYFGLLELAANPALLAQSECRLLPALWSKRR